MSTRLDQLRAQVATATTGRGAKSDLARWLAAEIPTAAAESWRVKVQDFLTGTGGVNGETALALADWLHTKRKTTPPPPRAKAAGGRMVRNN